MSWLGCSTCGAETQEECNCSPKYESRTQVFKGSINEYKDSTNFLSSVAFRSIEDANKSGKDGWQLDDKSLDYDILDQDFTLSLFYIREKE